MRSPQTPATHGPLPLCQLVSTVRAAESAFVDPMGESGDGFDALLEDPAEQVAELQRQLKEQLDKALETAVELARLRRILVHG